MKNMRIEECLKKLDAMSDFSEKYQLRSLVSEYGYLGTIEYLKPLNWNNPGRNQFLADAHSKILIEL